MTLQKRALVLCHWLGLSVNAMRVSGGPPLDVRYLAHLGKDRREVVRGFGRTPDRATAETIAVLLVWSDLTIHNHTAFADVRTALLPLLSEDARGIAGGSDVLAVPAVRTAALLLLEAP